MCYLIASFTATVNLYAATLISNTGSMSDIIKERLKIIFLAVPLACSIEMLCKRQEQMTTWPAETNGDRQLRWQEQMTPLTKT